MFVPRKFQKRSTPPKPPPSTSLSKLDAEPAPLLAPANRAGAELGGVDNVDTTTAREIVMSLEILLSDYSLEKVHSKWLNGKMREFEGKGDYIHLSAFLDCQYLSTIKPALSQISLKKALTACKSDVLELSSDGYYVRRKTKNSLYSQNETQDPFTIYIEPDVPTIISNPGRVSRILSDSDLPRKYFPIQFVENTQKPWTFVTLSSMLAEDDTTNKRLWPKDWVVLTKSEWQKRDSEYQALLTAQLRTIKLNNESLPNTLTQSDIPEINLRKDKLMNSDSTSLREENASRRGFTNDPSFERGLIVRITNLHPSATKIVIEAFVSRSVDRYLRKRQEEIQPLRISYIDYEKGLDEAYLRLGNQKDSALIVRALKKRKRSMRDGEDSRGGKGANKEDRVLGRVLSGEEERIYWEKVLAIKGKRGKAKHIQNQRTSNNKRVGLDNEVSGLEPPKRLKFQ